MDLFGKGWLLPPLTEYAVRMTNSTTHNTCP